MESALRTVRQLILEKYDIKHHYDESQEIWQYRIVDKRTGAEYAQIQLSMVEEATVAKYSTSDHWFKPSDTMTVSAINVRWLTSNQKGLGSLMLAYGVLEMNKQFPKIEYSVLDDDSDQSTHKTKNIYSRFGYSPVEAVTRVGENTVQLQGPEKQVLLTDFVTHVRDLFSTRSRSRSREKSANANTRSRSRRASRTRS